MSRLVARKGGFRGWIAPARRGFAAVLMLTGLLLAGCAPSEEPPLRVATIEWIGYQPLNIAHSLGALAPGEIRVARFASNTESLRAFRNRSVDVAALTLDEALLLRADGHDIRVILLMDYSHGADTILARPGIDTLADLAGHRIGVENSAATAYLLARGLEHAGLDTDAVEVVRVDAGRHAEAFRQGEVDALATFEPIRTRLLQDGAVELFDSTRIPGEIVDVLVAHRDALDLHRTHLSELVAAWFRALDHLEHEPDHARAVLADQTGLPLDALDLALGGVQFPSLAENCKALANDGQALHASARELVALMRENRLLPRPVTLDELFDDQVVRAVGCPDHPTGT